MAHAPRRCIVLLAALPACDAAYAGFLDAIPQPGAPASAPAHVILGVDGVSRAAFDAARARGAFAGWDDATLVSVFPGTSDYAWTRTLRSAPIGGYEVEYYDAARRRRVGAGVAGIAEHGLRGQLGAPPWSERFDFLGDGLLWVEREYADPEAALPAALREMFSLVEARGRRQRVVRAYLPYVDVMGHLLPRGHAVDALAAIAREIAAFQERHPGRFAFTIVSDHGNDHLAATLVDPEQALRNAGVAPVDALGDVPALEAVAVVHVRVSYVALHTHPSMRAEIAARLSRHPWVDLAVAPLGDARIAGAPARRYGAWREGRMHAFARGEGGATVVEDAAAWRAMGVEAGAGSISGEATLDDDASFARTLDGPWPDLFHRVDGAFRAPAAAHPADVILSLRPGFASYGFRLPGGIDGSAKDGFHGSLAAASTLSVVATQTGPLPPFIRSDELADVLPDLVER